MRITRLECKISILVSWKGGIFSDANEYSAGSDPGIKGTHCDVGKVPVMSGCASYSPDFLHFLLAGHPSLGQRLARELLASRLIRAQVSDTELALTQLLPHCVLLPDVHGRPAQDIGRQRLVALLKHDA